MQYDAFISYSHAHDGQLAPAIQSGLRRIAFRWPRSMAQRIFRDETDLAANPGLWSSVTRALDESRYFVLLASVEAVASIWVQRELSYWLERHGLDTVLLVITGGIANWDGTRGEFEDLDQSCIPRQLATAYEEEPLFVDLRWARDEPRLDLRDPRFADAIAELAAPLRGTTKSQVIGDELRERRRQRRILTAGVSGLAVLAVALAIAGIIAATMWRRSEARGRELLAEQLAAVSISRAGSDPIESLTSALVSLRVRETPAGHRALLESLTTARPAPEALPLGAERRPLVFSPDGRLLVVTDYWNLILLESGSWRLVAERALPQDDCGVRRATFAQAGQRLLTVGSCGVGRVWTVPELEPISSSGDRDPLAPEKYFATNAAGDLVAIGDSDVIRTYTVDSLQPEEEIHRPFFAGRTVTGLAFVREDLLVVGFDDGRLAVVDPTIGSVVQVPSPHRSPVKTIQVSPLTPNRLLTLDQDGRVAGWELESLGNLHTLHELPFDHFDQYASASFRSDGLVMTVSLEGRLSSWSVGDSAITLVTEFPLPGLRYSTDAVLSPDGSLAIATVSKVAYAWSLSKHSTLRRQVAVDMNAKEMVFLGSERLAVASHDQVWIGSLTKTDIEDGLEWTAPYGQAILAITASDAGDTLLVTTVDSVISLDVSKEGEVTPRWTARGPWPADLRIARVVSPEEIAVAATDGDIFLLDSGSGNIQASLSSAIPRFSRVYDLMTDEQDHSLLVIDYGDCVIFHVDNQDDCGALVFDLDDQKKSHISDIFLWGDLIAGKDMVVYAESKLGIRNLKFVPIGDQASISDYVSFPAPLQNVVSSADGSTVLASAVANDYDRETGMLRLIDISEGKAKQVGTDLYVGSSDLLEIELSYDGSWIGIVADGRVTIYARDAFDLAKLQEVGCATLGRDVGQFDWESRVQELDRRSVCSVVSSR